MTEGLWDLAPREGQLTLPNGCTLYWSSDELGRIYDSDEVGGGVRVWIPAILDKSTLLTALAVEESLVRKEQMERRKP